MDDSDPRLGKRPRVECPTCRVAFTDAAQLGRHMQKYKDACAVFQPGAAVIQPRPRNVVANVAPSTTAASAPAPAAAGPDEQSTDVSDVDMHLMVLTQTANGGRGMPDADVTELLELFKRVRSTGVLPSVTSLAAHKASLKSVGVTQWQEHDIVLTSENAPRCGIDEHNPIRVKFRCIDLLEWLKSEYSNTEYKGNFVVHAIRERDLEGARLYTHAHQAERWNKMQDALRRASGAQDAVIAALQLYSDKTLLNNKNLSAHPIRATLLNVMDTRRLRIMKDVGFFPILHQPPNMPSAQWRIVKLTIYALCLDILLEGVKRCSHEGIKGLPDPDGALRTVHPMLMSYVTDDPEAKDMSACKSGNLPCELCKVPRDQLCDILNVTDIVPRSEAEQRAAVERALGAARSAGRGERGSGPRVDDLGVHPVRCGLWGFACATEAGGWGSSHVAFGYDTMHVEDLGVFLYIVYSIPEYLKRKYPDKHGQLLGELHARMCCMPRADDFRLPCPDGGYFNDKGRIQAKEHRVVMQALPFLLHGLDSDLTKLACLWTASYKLRHRKGLPNCITDDLLKDMRNSLARLHDAMRSTVLPLMKSEGNTIKYHKLMNHSVRSIELLGNLQVMSSQFYEAAHLHLKWAYKATSKRVRDDKYMAEVVQRLQAREVSDAAQTKLLAERQGSSKPNNTAHAQVVRSGESRLVKGGEKVAWQHLSERSKALAPRGLNLGWIEAAHALLKYDPSLQQLPRLLSDLKLADNVQSPNTPCITVVMTGELSAEMFSEKVVQTVHASRQFFGAPWHDFVAIMGQEANSSTGAYTEVEWYAQLRLLFWWGDLQLACIRWLRAERRQEQDSNRVLRDIGGCHSFRWEGSAYQVLPFASILRRVYIVPDFSTGSFAARVASGEVQLEHAIQHATRLYEASPFKWDASTPDYRTWEERELHPDE